MNILVIAHLFAFLVYSCLLLFLLLWKDGKSNQKTSCSFFISCFALWSFTYIFLYNPELTKDSAILLDNIASCGWISFASFFLWFALIFSEKKILLRNRLVYLLIFLPPLFFIYKKWTGVLISDYILKSFGWIGIWSKSVWTYLYFAYYLIFVLIAIGLIYNFGKKTKIVLRQKQAQIIFYTSLLSLLVSTFVEVFLPLSGIIQLPTLANVINLVLAGGIVFAILKYGFMTVTPIIAAQQIISTMADSLLLLDRDGNINCVNKALLDLSGYQEKELLGKSMELLLNKDEWQKILSFCQVHKKTYKNIELNLNKKNGEQIPVILSISPVIDDNLEIAGIVCICTEITELKKMREVLEKSQQEAISLFQNSPLPGIYQDENGIILNINKKFTELFGYTGEELIGKNINEGMIFPEDKKLEESIKLTQKALAGGDIKFETMRKKKDGTSIPVIITVSAVIRKGEKKAIVAFYNDISKEREYLEKITESEIKYRALFQNMPAAYYQTDQDGNIVMMNPAGIKLLGFQSLDEVLGKNLGCDFYYNPQDRITFLKILKESGGKVRDYEVVLKNKEGQTLIVSTNSQYYYHQSGEIAGVEGVFIDITERKKLEEALRKSQQEFASLFHSHPEALCYLDNDGTVLDINKRFTELFGYTLGEIKEKNINCGIIHPPEKIAEGGWLEKKAFAQGYLRFETIRKKKDGTLFPVSISGSPVLIEGEVRGIIGIYIDITERKELEEKLKKMAQIDSLTGCFNRRYGLELLKRQINFAKRTQSPLLIAFLDIDNFKNINDCYGHQEGDKVLEEASKLFKSTLREIDIILRMGGDEFLLVFPHTSYQEAPIIRRRLEKNLLSLNRNIKKGYQIQFSIGFAEWLSLKPKSVDEFIAIADQMMYLDKKKKS